MIFGSFFKPKDLWSAARKGDVAAIDSFLGLGSDVNARDASEDRYTPLHYAAVAGHTEALKALIAHGANVNRKAGDGETPLIEAVQNSKAAVVELLISLGADMNAQDKGGMTALDWAAFSGNEKMVRLLLQQGASVNVCSGNCHPRQQRGLSKVNHWKC